MAQPERKVTLHPQQSRAFATDARFVALIAGTGGGKTFFGPPWLCNEISKYPDDQWMIIAPTYKILSRATIPTFLKFVEGTEFEGEYKESRGVYELPDGGTIYCISADNWKGIEGGQFRGVWLDEAGQMGKMVWIAVQARLGLKQGRALFTTTPYPVVGADWLLTDIVNKAQTGNKTYFCIQFKSIDNPHYPKEEYERARLSMPKALFEMRYEGAFTKLSGLVYPDMDKCFTTADPEPIIQAAKKGQWEMFGGMDWGFRDPFCALVGAEDPDGTLHIFYEHYESRLTIPAHAQLIEEAGMAETVFFGDPSGAQQIEDMNALGLSVVAANNSLLAGIETVTQRINSGFLKIYSSACPNLVREWGLYRYPAEEEDGTRMMLQMEKPIDRDNHSMDTLRYLIRGMDGDTGGSTVILSSEERVRREAKQSLVDHVVDSLKKQIDNARYAPFKHLLESRLDKIEMSVEEQERLKGRINAHRNILAQRYSTFAENDDMLDEETRISQVLDDEHDWNREENPAVWE